MSDQMSVSSGTTGVMSQGSHPHPQGYNNVQQASPHTYNPTTTTYFYPSSHIHNAPLSHPLAAQSHPYISSPPIATGPPPSLTTILLTSAPQQFAQATEHPFLRLAGQGTLPKHTLSRWLSQDRLYAQAYMGFIGSLIARVDLPYVNVTDKSTSLRWRIVNCLTGALQNIHTELKFFEHTAAKYGLELDAPTRADGMFTAEHATKQYIDLFRAFWTDPSMSLLEGMVVLWATETVYLSAWNYAKSMGQKKKPTTAADAGCGDTKEATATTTKSSEGVMSELEGSEVNTLHNNDNETAGRDDAHEKSNNVHDSTNPAADDDTESATTPSTAARTSTATTTHSSDLDGGALRDAFIPNWTSAEFEAFVADIAELTDLLAEREDAVTRRLDVYRAVWKHILDVERRFWPDVSVGGGAGS
ncbi:uncharacterized protein Z520_06569 [Fonsecaea multimorphosa CBS 102226]|uniref:Thiaminase-2/PQQC domain-containing protein n=1 Tax=Fonsecaea multimorphosa CBS 102226 TaxID=1442371 RepID=A0A0D2IL89_9EURO|nr:uncharacterized protein Z520_06569 [Fonsecaea multimorphosa CBS 102226]KIX97791.1 hypothetical protein Z520_06569 [Fonsecaea multimorphosa CBS 102226]OAL23811.1 hypothetical protein AYO22_06130 [Fonsecaea multimorphosa]